jgi:hypothetical protein
MVIFTDRYVTLSAAAFCALVARWRRCPQLSVAVSYVVNRVMPPETNGARPHDAL